MVDNNKDKISIQVGLSGYSFRVEAEPDMKPRFSGWMSAERFFDTGELQKRYDDVAVSVFTHKFSLVPSGFHDPEKEREILGEVVKLDDSDVVESIPVPQIGAVLLYSSVPAGNLPRVVSETVLRKDGTKARILPEVYHMLAQLSDIQDYNKIMASYMDGYLHLVISQGKSLLLCNAFRAVDFTTAEYFIFMAMKKLQLNPEVSAIYFRTPLAEEEELSLYRYFKTVEQL